MKFDRSLTAVSFTNFFILLTISLSLLGIANRGYGATSRSELQAKMYTDIIHILASSDVDGLDQKVLSERARQISSIVQYYPQDIIPDDMAAWIERSTLPIVKKRKPYLVSDDNIAARYIKHIDDAAKANFSQLSASMIPKVRKRSKELLAAAGIYREKRNLYLVGHLSHAKMIRFDFGDDIFTGIDSFSDILLAIKPELSLPWLKSNEKNTDVSNSKIDSMLLTCAFVRKVKNYINADEEGDIVGYTSLLSSVLFIDGFETRDFSTVLPKVEKLWSKAVTQDGDVTIIDYDAFSYFLMKSSTLHWENDIEFNKGENVAEKKITVPSYVIFQNESYPWQILQDTVFKKQGNSDRMKLQD